MKIKILKIFIVNIAFLGFWLDPVFAFVHSQKEGLFSMDIPAEWHWVDTSQEVLITYMDKKTVAIDIQLIPSRLLSASDIKRTIKEGNEKMINEGIEAHQGVLMANKEISLDGVYATRLDFQTKPNPDPIHVTYISLFNRGYAMTITYGSEDEKMHSVLDDVVASLKFNK